MIIQMQKKISKSDKIKINQISLSTVKSDILTFKERGTLY